MNKHLIWVFMFVFIDVLGFSIILPLLPFYGEEFHASPSSIGMLLTSNAVTQMITAPLIGSLSDSYGRKPLLLICIVSTFVGFVMLATANSLLELFLSRILDGMLGGNIALAQAYISDVTDEKERSKAFGIIGAAFGLGFIFGPALGGILSIYGFRYPAYTAAVVSLVNFIGVAFWLPESLPKDKRKTSNSSSYYESFSHLSSAFGVPVLGQLLVLRFAYGFTFTLFETCFGFYNIQRLSLTARNSSFLLAYVGLIFSTVQGGAIKSFIKRMNEGRIILYSLGLLSVSLVLWVCSFDITSLSMALFPLAFASGLLNTLINSEITKQVQQSALGGTLGLSAAIGSLTRVLAPASSGILIEELGISAPGIFGALLMAWMAYYVHSNKLHLLPSAPNGQAQATAK